MQALFGSLFTTATAFALGWLLTRKLDVPSPIRFAAGAAALHLMVFGLMLGGYARLPVLATIGALFLAAAITGRNACATQQLADVVAQASQPVFGLVCIFAVVYIVNALAPEIQADANAYHLNPAIEASRSGGFGPEISFYDRLPQATELLFAFAYPFGGVPAAKLLHLTFVFWTLPLIVAVGRKLGMPDPLPAIAATMYFVTPVVGVSGSSAFNDGALLFYVAATVWTLLAWRDSRSNVLALLAGVCAGMCYAVKMNGGIAIAAGGVFLLAMRQWRALALFAVGAAAVTLPWLIRNLLDTGNPFAPFFNALFPNEYFYAGPEQELRQTLRSYGVLFAQRFWEVTAGWRLHSMIGPVFLLVPLTLIAIRRSSVRWLWLFAIVFSGAWWMNADTRFLMPALPFLALAFAAAFPPRLTVTLLVAHAVLSWPWVIPVYSPRTWRLTGFPWRAAAGLESSEDYLARVSWDYRAVRMVQQNTPAGSRIFDLHGLHQAHLSGHDTRIIGSWQSAQAHRLLAGLDLARRDTLSEWRADFETRLVAAVRLRQQSPKAANWSLNEVQLYRAGVRLGNRQTWRLEARSNVWDMPLAFDRNSTSRWSTWQPSASGDIFLIDFGRPEMLDSVRAISPGYESDARPAVELKNTDGTWIVLQTPRRPAPPLVRLRLEAVRLLTRAGVTHIVTPVTPQGIGALGGSLVNEARDWGLDVITNMDSVYLLRVRQTP